MEQKIAEFSERIGRGQPRAFEEYPGLDGVDRQRHQLGGERGIGSPEQARGDAVVDQLVHPPRGLRGVTP